MSGCHEPNVRTPFEQQQDNRYQELLNAVADLSMKLNMMHSSLREFEKQRVVPIRDRVTELEEWTRKEEDAVRKILNHHSQQLEDFEARLDEMEDGDY